MSQTAQAVVQNLVDRAVKLGDRQLAADIRAFAAQRQFGLVFEHNRPERLRLYGKPIMKGDVVQVLPERGRKEDSNSQLLWLVNTVRGGGAQQHFAVSGRDTCPVGRFPDIEPDDGFRHSSWCHGGILQSVGRSEPLPATPTLPGRGACARQFPISRPERRAPPVATPPGPSTGQGQTAIRRRPIGGPSGLARIVGNAPNARHRILSIAYFRL